MKKTGYIKRIFLILGIIFVVMGSAEKNAVKAEEVHEIHTAEDMMNIRTAPFDTYVLMEDIDLSEIEWIPFEFGETLTETAILF